MAKFDLYEKSTWPPSMRRTATSPLQFAGGTALWFLLVFFVGYLILGL